MKAELRKVRFWVRLLPRTRTRHRTEVVQKIYRTKRQAKDASRPSEEIMEVKGFYFTRPEPIRRAPR